MGVPLDDKLAVAVSKRLCELGTKVTSKSYMTSSLESANLSRTLSVSRVSTFQKVLKLQAWGSEALKLQAWAPGSEFL